MIPQAQERERTRQTRISIEVETSRTANWNDSNKRDRKRQKTETKREVKVAMILGISHAFATSRIDFKFHCWSNISLRRGSMILLISKWWTHQMERVSFVHFEIRFLCTLRLLFHPQNWFPEQLNRMEEEEERSI